MKLKNYINNHWALGIIFDIHMTLVPFYTKNILVLTFWETLAIVRMKDTMKAHYKGANLGSFMTCA